MTKYEKIAETIRKRIREGVYPVDSNLPNQNEFVAEFGVSRVTIKKAINILMMEGLVYSQRGSGTRVLGDGLWLGKDFPAKEYEGLTYQMQGRDVKSQLIAFGVEFPTEDIQKKLMIGAHQPIYHFVRLRLVDGDPYVLEYTFMPTDLVSNLTEEILAGSVYKYIHQDLGIDFAGTHRNIKADRATADDQQYLDCGVHDPILEMDQIIYLHDGRAIEYSRCRHRFDKRSYSVLEVIE